MTIVAIATPPGTGALGIVRLSGSEAYSIAAGLLSLPPGGLIPRRATLARATADGRLLDHVVATYFPAPNNATGEELIEISSHGSPYILRCLVDETMHLGARAAEPGEFTRRAFLNGRLDLAQAEAVGALIRARSDRAHRAALTQLEGGLSKRIASLRGPILDTLIAIEASLDHPEEDLPRPSASRTIEGLEASGTLLREMAETHRTGRIFADGARIGIVGRTNAGKSSLFNALLGSDRAIVCPSPGTTRDTIEEPAEACGIPLLLIDTAGLRDEASSLAERSGIERSERVLKTSDMTLLVIDSSRPLSPEDEKIHRRIAQSSRTQGQPLITIGSKSDLAWRLGDFSCDLMVSALKGSGIRELKSRLAAHLATDTSQETNIILSARHHRLLLGAAETLAAAVRVIREDPAVWEDKAASLLHSVLDDLGSITGESASDEILNGIFSRFCIGK